MKKISLFFLSVLLLITSGCTQRSYELRLNRFRKAFYKGDITREEFYKSIARLEKEQRSQQQLREKLISPEWEW